MSISRKTIHQPGDTLSNGTEQIVSVDLKYYISIALIVALSAGLRFFWLTHQSLWYDEGISLVLSDQDSFQANLSRILSRRGGDKYQPLYYLVLFAWRSLVGDSEFMVRSLSVVLGIASVILVFLITHRVFGKRHAFWSTLLIASSSFCVYYSQEVRAYSLQLFLAALQLYFFSKALTPGKAGLVSRLGFAVMTGINFFGGVLLVLFSMALCISHVLIYRRIKDWLLWWVPAGLCSIPVVMYYLSTPAVSDPTQDATNALGLPIIKNAVFTIYGLLVGTTYGPPLNALRGEGGLKQIVMSYWPDFLALILVLAGLGLSLLVYLWRFSKASKYRQADYFFVALFVTSFALAAAFAAATKINWLPRHSFYIYLPICILLPMVIGRGFRHSEAKRGFYSLSQLSRMALIGLAILNLYSSFNYLLNPIHWRDDYRSAAQYLIENRQPSDTSVLLWGTTRLLSYYGDTETLNGTQIPKDQLVEGVSQLTDNADTVFVVVNREFLWSRNQPQTIIQKMSDQYSLTSKASFNNFNIYRFNRS